MRGGDHKIRLDDARLQRNFIGAFDAARLSGGSRQDGNASGRDGGCGAVCQLHGSSQGQTGRADLLTGSTARRERPGSPIWRIPA